MINQIIRRCLDIASRPIVDQLNNIQLNVKLLQKQIERLEDRIIRIENALESSGMLSKESRINIRHLNPGELGLEEAFDYIYEHRIWSVNEERPSGEGSYGPWAEHFIKLVEAFIKTHSVRSITDIGCGDFNVGSQFCRSVDKYYALDASAKIISYDKKRYSEFTQVSFQQANACRDPLPKADLAVIRQVLQHLSNEQIENLLQNVEKTGYKFVLVAEHVPTAKEMIGPNFDLERHSSGIRLKSGSGVFIDAPPFSRQVQTVGEYESSDGRLIVFLWEPQPQK